MNQPTRTPLGALIPGLLGVLPFWGFALATVVDAGVDPLLALMGLMMYGAVILSFVGALWWGLGRDADHARNRSAYLDGGARVSMVA